MATHANLAQYLYLYQNGECTGLAALPFPNLCIQAALAFPAGHEQTLLVEASALLLNPPDLSPLTHLTCLHQGHQIQSAVIEMAAVAAAADPPATDTMVAAVECLRMAESGKCYDSRIVRCTHASS